MLQKTPNYLKIAIALTLTNLLILALRNLFVGDFVFNFLRSNLFIGSFPTLMLAVILDCFHTKMHQVIFWVIMAILVLFYPNCPYMISDLIHIHQDPAIAANPELIVYDTLIVFSIAMLSVFYGFLSLKIVFRILSERRTMKFAHYAVFIILILSCFGFYMGRELLSAIKLGNGYMYSWEIFLEPIQIIKTVWKALWPIGSHLPAYAMIILFGIIQYMLLIMFKDIKDIETIYLTTKD